MIKRLMVTLPALTGDKQRRAYIYLPKSYFKDTDKHYPVLYMFDGHNVFFDSDATYGVSWRLKDYLDYDKTELIVAAVECNHSKNHGRLKEYSPFDFYDEKMGKIRGLGSKTMKWLIESFKPYVDENYRTLSDREHTFIAGSSMGGLMSIYALMRYNKVFSRAAALSPSLWTDPEQLRKLIVRGRILDNTVLYMDYGSLEFDNHPGMKGLFRDFSDLFVDKGIFLTSRIVPYGEHCEACWAKQVPIFINILME